jgi:hypothetical protein
MSNILPGGGPWLVLSECPAPRHSSLAAARGRNGAVPCICPRAKALREKELERCRAVARARRIEAGLAPETLGRGHSHVPRWLKAGPWKVLEDCPARGHNSVTWARGGRGNKYPRCICPRALYVFAEYRAGRNGLEQQQRVRTTAVLKLARAPKIIEPDWTDAACRTNLMVADMGFNTEASHKGIAYRAVAKNLCNDGPCRVKLDCELWIKAREGDKPGSIDGVYAGMDPWNRRGEELAPVDGKIRRVPYVRAA